MQETAIQAARKAGDVLMMSFRKNLKAKRKSSGQLVTDADIKSEKRIIESISNEFPEHSILSEEAGEIRRNSYYKWIIDPLDGTNNFAYGFPHFGVSIALEHQSELILGIVYLPFFNELYVAEKNGGASKNSKPISVSEKGLSDAFMIYESELYFNDKEPLRKLDRLIDAVFTTRVFGAPSLDLVSVASGEADICIHLTVEPEDIAAGGLIVEEAGGKVTDLDGRSWSPYKGQLVASNGKAHSKIIEYLRGSSKFSTAL